MKIFNIKGIAVLIGIFLILQVGFAFLLSPILAPIVIKSVNMNSRAKISVDKVTVWPLTLLCVLKDLKVFDPDNEAQRIAMIKKVSVRVSVLALLSKRLVISKLSVKGAEINLRGEADGSFNIQKLAETKKPESEEKKPGVLYRFKGKKDWFGRISEMVKKKFSDKKTPREIARTKEVEKITGEVVELPKGRRVKFVTPKDRYIFEIKNLSIGDSRLVLDDGSGKTLDIENASVTLKDLRMDPKAGVRFSKISAKGEIQQSGKAVGSIDIQYAQSLKGEKEKVLIDLSAREVDLVATRFIYGDSLPIEFSGGTLTLSSETKILDGKIDSTHLVILAGHNAKPRGGMLAVGVVPMPVICDALNKINPARIEFQITGTLEAPKFEGFQKALLDLVKPSMAGSVESLKEKGISALSKLLKK